MFISDGKNSLKIAEPEDARQIYEWENDRSVWRVSETSCPTSLFQVEQFLVGNSDLWANRQLRLMICREGVECPVGSIDLFEFDPVNSRIGIGILIEKAWRGQGIATQALTLCLDYLAHNVMVHQVHCLIDVLNEESRRLFLGLGFNECGRRKDWIKTPEGYLDAVFYQKIIEP